MNANIRTLFRFSAWATIVLALHSSVFAEDDLAAAADVSRIQITITPGVWMTRLNGTGKLGSSPLAQDINFEDAFNLDDSEPAFAIETSVVKDDYWHLDFSGFHFSTDSSGMFTGNAQFGSLAINDGDLFNTSLDMTSIAAEFGWWLWQPYCIGNSESGVPCHLSLQAGPGLGLRYLNVNQTVDVMGLGSQTGKGDWISPFASFQFRLRNEMPPDFPILDAFEIEAAVGVGPILSGDGGWLAQIRAGMTWYFTRNFAVGFGYRLLQLNAENDDYTFEGGLQGLFFSASVRF